MRYLLIRHHSLAISCEVFISCNLWGVEGRGNGWDKFILYFAINKSFTAASYSLNKKMEIKIQSLGYGKEVFGMNWNFN